MHVFVARRLNGTNKYIIFPSPIIQKLVEEGKLYLMGGKEFRISFRFSPDGRVLLKGKGPLEDVTDYVNKWNLIS